MSLPTPAAGRYKPLRCGLVELFLYEAQEFLFTDGRLLLRGDNGTGKSKVLALTLPLLLDANLRPSRLEPDADPNKHMAWNLLMSDEHDERTGYSWVEFGRVDQDGQEHFVTLGLGMKAVQHRGVVKQWWFITDQRIGLDLHLVDRARTVRTQERLVEAIGVRGTVFDQQAGAERYRRAVDETLFGLGTLRYGALMDLLVHLRQPQLSKRPNEQQLARALTEALQPMRDELIELVAQSYQALEDEEHALNALRAAAQSVRKFSNEYTRYARVATRRATAAPRRAQSEYEDLNRKARQVEEALGKAADREQEVDTSLVKLDDLISRMEATLGALRLRRSSEKLVELDSVRENAEATRLAADSLAESAKALRSAAEGAASNLRSTQQAAARREGMLASKRAALAELVTAAGVDLPTMSEDPDELVRRSSMERRRRGEQVSHLRALLAGRADAEKTCAEVQRQLDSAESRVAAAAEALRSAQSVAADTSVSWVRRVTDHLEATVELVADGLDAAVAEATEWTNSPVGEGNPVAGWAHEAWTLRNHDLARELTALDEEARRIDLELATVNQEIAGLEAGQVRLPPRPYTRLADRAATIGAAFWECVEIQPNPSEQDLAGIEAALEAAGLLDAWIYPDGSVTSAEGDTVLRPLPLQGRTLADVLVPFPTSDVGELTIADVLRSIAVEADPQPGMAAVSPSGAFALGPLTGSWTKPSAEFLGARAREAARLARLVELRETHAGLVAAKAQKHSELQVLNGRLELLGSELADLPSDEAVRDAMRRCERAAGNLADATTAAAAAKGAFTQAESSRDLARSALADASALYLLNPESVDDVWDALVALPGAATAVVDAINALREMTASEDDAAASVEVAKGVWSTADANAQEARSRAIAAAQRLETLEATVGAASCDLDEQISRSEGELKQAKASHKTQTVEKQKASNAVAITRTRLDGIGDEVAESAARRIAATSEFQAFGSTGLLGLAVPKLDLPDVALPWAPDPTVRIARRALDTLGGFDVDQREWDQSVQRLFSAFEEVQAALSRQGRQAWREQREGVTTVSVQHGSASVQPLALAEDLEAELADRQRLLTEKERAVLETHLIDEVGAQLHLRVQEAMRQVNRMNDELTRRQTRSGLRLRIRWDSKDEELDRAGRQVLQQKAEAWSPEDRAAVGEYLRSRIAAARVEDPEGSWHERLRRAFDYRSWNKFSVQINQNGKWRPASGPASGGERVLAASVPLFAAAASHYASASDPHAPRLILLDEAFAGVDDRSRASYLGLLAEFDLDVVMTSEREWATYPEVPGIAIANLFRLPGMSAVHVEHWTWNGAVRERVDDPGMSAMAPQPKRAWGEDELPLADEELPLVTGDAS